jgi:hypothetical protein
VSLFDYLAAVLACGAGAVISHRAAAHLLRLLRGAAPPPEVTVPSTGGHPGAGIVVHRVRVLPEGDTAQLHGIPLTTVPRTLLDLAPPAAPPRARALADDIDHRGDKVDCHRPDRDITIELLSYRFHASRQAFELDVARRRRSNHLAYTYGDVFERARQTAAEVAALLR